MRVVYTLPMSLSSEDSFSATAKVLVMVKDCGGFGNSNDMCEGWNFNHCPNDKDYCQPFIHGDKIYFQLFYDKNKYTISSLEVIDSATGLNVYSASFVTTLNQITALNSWHYDVVVDTGNALFVNIDCFYIKTTLLAVDNSADVYYSSEPYCVVKCDEKTMLITGEYPSGYDCFGGYYGVDAGDAESVYASINKASIRVRGVVESDNFDFEKTENNGITIKSKQFERFLFRIQPVPYYVAQQIAICFNSKKVTIDAIEYKGTIKLQKNNDEGSMWISNETIFRECDEINFTCN